MKKICALIMMMITIPAMSNPIMCSKNDAITIMLDPSINGNGYGFNQENSTWWTAFSYGTIRGLSACLSGARGQSMGGTVSKLTDTDPDTNESKRVVGGETNGQYCWCRMTHPALSRWAFSNGTGSASICASNCAYYCGHDVQRSSALRAGLFGSVKSN